MNCTYINYGTVLDAPFILMAQPQTQSTGVAGHAWLAVTDKCVLHYQILLSGLRDHTTITALITGKYDSAPSYSGNAIYTIIITDFKNGIVSICLFACTKSGI